MWRTNTRWKLRSDRQTLKNAPPEAKIPICEDRYRFPASRRQFLASPWRKDMIDVLRNRLLARFTLGLVATMFLIAPTEGERNARAADESSTRVTQEISNDKSNSDKEQATEKKADNNARAKLENGESANASNN